MCAQCESVPHCVVLLCGADCQLSVHKSCLNSLIVPCPGGSVRASRLKDRGALTTMLESLKSQLPVSGG